MANRLSAREAVSYFLDDAGTTTHLGALLILPGDSGKKRSAPKPVTIGSLDYPSLARLVENRLQLAPRYRQVVREVALALGRPVWIDDPDFDINFHIRRSGLPRPGNMGDLDDLISRVMSRPLDRSRPLWEMYLIEGLADGGLAILTKSHKCLVDDGDPEISTLICDDTAQTAALPADLWMPGTPPGAAELAIGAITETLARPGELIDSVLGGNGLLGEARAVVSGVARRAGRVVQQLTDSAPSSVLNTPGSSTRMFTVATAPRRGVAKIAERYRCTVNDVELAIITGSMRRWLLSVDAMGEFGDTVRAMLPLGAREKGVTADPVPDSWINVDEPTFVTDLPVGESNPQVRLAQVAGLAHRYSQSSRRVSSGAQPLFAELGVVPFGELSSRAFRSLDRRGYNVPVSMGTAPISQRYVLGRPVGSLYAVPNLVSGRALAVSVVEYVDHLGFAFIADRGVMTDLPEMAEYVTESYEELVEGK